MGSFEGSWAASKTGEYPKQSKCMGSFPPFSTRILIVSIQASCAPVVCNRYLYSGDLTCVARYKGVLWRLVKKVVAAPRAMSRSQSRA